MSENTIAITAADSWRGGSLTYWILRNIKSDFSEVRALVRHEDRAQDLRSAGAVLKKIKYDKPETIENALKGVRYLVLIPEDGGKIVKEAEEIISAAKKNNVEVIVFISSALVEKADRKKPRFHEYKEIEDKVSKYEKRHLILRISVPDQLFLLWSPFVQGKGKFPLSVKQDSKWAPIDGHDIGRVIQRVLAVPDHLGQSDKQRIIVLTGPELLKAEEVVKKFDQAIGSGVKLETVSREEMKKDLESLAHKGVLPDKPDNNEYYPRYYHMDGGFIELILEAFDAIRDGEGQQQTDEVKKITGNNAVNIEKWFEDNSAYFGGRSDKK